MMTSYKKLNLRWELCEKNGRNLVKEIGPNRFVPLQFDMIHRYKLL
jgi:hypothetical protein